MPTGLIYSDRFLEHDTGAGHPERPDRLRAIVDKLKATGLWDRATHLPFQPAPLEWIERLHKPEYVRRVRDACERGEPFVDVPDSAVCGKTYDIALLATGGVLAAVDAVMSDTIDNAFCVVRPPGHHAEASQAMGFCFFNHVAIAAEYLIAKHGVKRVAIVDIDVHHGNGTQHLFEHRSDVFFVSMHEHPAYLYPGTGHASETGKDEGAGHTLNIGLDPGSGDGEYRRAMLTMVTPALERFKPEFVLMSTGFDAAKGDPLAHMELTPHGYAWLTFHLKSIAEDFCRGKLVSSLEGGYNLRNLAECAALHVETLMRSHGEDPMMAMKAGL